MGGAALALAALELVGCRFRVHGRDPATGLDCVGLVSAALAQVGVTPNVPQDYALRNKSAARVAQYAEGLGLIPYADGELPGDILLLQVGPCQFHFVLRTLSGFVHAHAGLRKVVVTPILPDGDVIGAWRLSQP
jgi:cell wall-associated NlpC family hydrolase